MALSQTSILYTVGDASINVDTNATLGDGGSFSYTGAKLTVTILTNASSEDVLAIEPQGSNPLTVQNTNLAYNGVGFGSFSGGRGSNSLVVKFNINATSANVNDLLQQVTFATLNTNTNLRVIEFKLTYGAVTVTGVRSIDVNRVPVVMDSQFTASEGETIYISYSSVLANDSDPDRDRLSITDFSLISSKGGRITSSSGRFTYRPPADSVTDDSFGYLADDGRGGQTVGFINIHFTKENRLQITVAPDSTPTITMGGVPDHVYRIDASEDLVHWAPIGTVTASSLGMITINDMQAMDRPHRFYRAVAQ